MKKKRTLIASALVFVVIILALIPYFAGIKAEHYLKNQLETYQTIPYVTVKENSYSRGWFTSTQTLTLTIKPEFEGAIASRLPDNLKPLLAPIKVINHIRHVPFSGRFASAQAEFVFSDEAEKVLSRFFGNEAPLTLTNALKLNGTGQMTLNITPFDYSELSGIAIHWKGLSGTINYRDDFKHLNAKLEAPGVEIQLADKGLLKLQGLKFSNKKNAQIASNRDISLSRLIFSWNDEIPYNIKLNELVNLLSNLQVGAFINPNGRLLPSKLELEDLALGTETVNEGEFSDALAHLSFYELQYGDKLYGPMTVRVSAKHLHRASLQKLAKLLRLPADTATGVTTTRNVLTLLKGDAAPLITNDPLFNIETFKLATPEGVIQASGNLAFNNVTLEDLNHADQFLQKTAAALNISLPRVFLENVAVNLATRFGLDSTLEPHQVDDVTNTIRFMANNLFDSWIRAGYITNHNGQLGAFIKLENQTWSMNQHVLKRDKDDELDEMPHDQKN